jgi:hypothetical protein
VKGAPVNKDDLTIILDKFQEMDARLNVMYEKYSIKSSIEHMKRAFVKYEHIFSVLVVLSLMNLIKRNNMRINHPNQKQNQKIK